MQPAQDDPLQSPQSSDSESPIANPKPRPPKSPLASVTSLPYRRSNASLSNLFASTTSLPTQQSSLPGQANPLASPTDSGTVTPPTAVGSAANGSVFSPAGSTVRSPSPALSGRIASGGAGSEIRDVILRAFSPHVSVLASQDTEELVRHKGIHGGLLELLRPFGERVPGKVTIRDSNGASRSWEDFAIRFVGVKDGLDSPRAPSRNSTDSAGARNGQRASMLEYKPARLRSGGDVPQVEELVERHLTFAEEQSGPVEADYINHKDVETSDTNATSPFYLLYLRRLLSGMPLVASETISHPVASVIAISSRSPSPIEELRTLYASSNTGEHRLPHWVHNEFLRYYVLIHDDDYDDFAKSMQLYDQMKRHFGLHCHLLRLKSTQCLPSDDTALKLPPCEWMAAAEELAEITRRETSEEDEDPTPWIFEQDATALRAFVREMVTQSIIPSLERASATWNDQVASRRRGISGRFMSLSKRFTAFGGSNRNSSVPSFGSGGGSNYDPLQGSYRPDAPEAVMRRLADYSMMLRDYKLAQSTYEILCQDFKGDKAWRHYAAANEMAAISSLVVTSNLTTRLRLEAVEGFLEMAFYSYITRVGSPYYALRTLVMGLELLKLRGGGALDEAARWAQKLLEDRLVGPIGHVLFMERIASCYAERKTPSPIPGAERKRKAAFWNSMACDAWLRLEKGSRAERCLKEAEKLYASLDSTPENFAGLQGFLQQLQDAVKANRSGPQHLDGSALLAAEEGEVEVLQDLDTANAPHAARRPSLAQVTSPLHSHKRSISTNIAAPPPPQIQTTFDSLGGAIPSAYETTPSTRPRKASAASAASASSLNAGSGVGVVPLSPHAEDLKSAQALSPVGERGRGGRGDDGFE